MYDNFYNALQKFITKKILADVDQAEKFKEICQKLKQADVNLFEVCCNLIEWVQDFIKNNNENTQPLQFAFEGNAEAEELLRKILIKHIPQMYFALYVYSELETYKSSLNKNLHVNVIDLLQGALTERSLPDFFVYMKDCIAKTDRIGRRYLEQPEKELLENIARLVNQYNKAVGTVSVPVTAFFESVRAATPAIVRHGVLSQAEAAVAAGLGKG